MTRLTFGVFFDDQRVMRLAALGKGISVPPPAREEQLLPPESFTWCTLHRQTRHFFFPEFARLTENPTPRGDISPEARNSSKGAFSLSRTS
jgi:hypothetical protein